MSTLLKYFTMLNVDLRRLLLVESLPRFQRGMSLVELMVAVVIGMATVLAVANAIILSEGQRRGTGSGSEAQNSASMGAYLVERDLRMAGYGIFTNEANGISEVCTLGTVHTYNANRAKTDLDYNSNLPFAPVFINPPGIPVGDTGTDVVMINYAGGSLGVVGAGVRLDADAAADGTTITVRDLGGFRAGDLMLVVEAARNCTISEITGVETTNSALLRGTAPYANDYRGGSLATPGWNKAGGLGVSYTKAGRVYNLGPPEQFVSVVYAVRNQQLTRCDLMQFDCAATANVNNSTIWVPIVSNIVLMRAEMGVDSDGDGALDAWRSGPCATANCVPTFAEWQWVKAMRLAVVSRSTQYAKELVTTAQPSWQGQTALAVDHLSDWQHYRYGSFELVAPIRNIVLWSSL
jgi:type IV pilus assembly protein PilW